MTTHDPNAGAPAQSKSLFDVAKGIAEKLDGIQKSDQERVLRWVTENLGIQLAPTTATPQPAHQAPVTTQGGGTPPAPITANRPKDIKSFKEEKQPKSDNQYAAVVAYYYRFEAPEGQRRDTINAVTLQESTRQSGWKRLASPGVTLSNSMAIGYLDRADRGEYTINTVGENLVAMTLPSGGDNGNSPVRKHGIRKKAVKKVRKRAPKYSNG